jgi:hypothetical protein
MDAGTQGRDPGVTPKPIRPELVSVPHEDVAGTITGHELEVEGGFPGPADRGRHPVN